MARLIARKLPLEEETRKKGKKKRETKIIVK